MSPVFVVDTEKKPLNPVHPGRARTLLSSGKAAVHKRFPFTIILKTAVESPQVQPLRIKLDPGSRTTGIALVDDTSGEVVFAAELTHRGEAIKGALDGSARRPSISPTAPYPLPKASLSESPQAQGMDCSLSLEPGVQRHHLGEPAHTSLSDHTDEHGARPI